MSSVLQWSCKRIFHSRLIVSSSSCNCSEDGHALILQRRNTFFQQNAHDNATDDAKISFYKQLPRVPYLTFLYHEELGQLICYLIDQ